MSAPVAHDHAPFPPQSPTSHHSSSDDESSLSSTDVEEENEKDFDGHRPSNLEISLSRSLSRRPTRQPQNPALDRALTPTVSRAQTAIARLRSRPVPQFTHPLETKETFEDVIVDFDGPDDPYKPINWPMKKKALTTGLYGLVTMSASWASSSYSAGTRQVSEHFHVGNEVAILGTTLFLFGFGIGPLLWAPLSEVYGRRIAVLVPMTIAICFSFGSATAKDFQTLMLTRFFGAFFASAPVTNTGGVLGDLFDPTQRGIAMAGYALAVVGGPCLGPIVSAAVVVQPSLGWRWTEYLTGILQILVVVLAIIFVDESYPPKLLVYKASRLRHETGNWALHAKFEEWDVSIKGLATKFLVRPVYILCTPICALVALYASFCYGMLYMQLGSIPIIFGEIRGWKPLVAELPFLGILIGAILAAALNTVNQHYYNKAYYAAGKRAVPERRLPPMMIGSVLFAGGQFLTGWTGSELHINWVVPCIGIVMLGVGFLMIFQAALNYLVDTFTQYAASAIAANTFLRSCFAGAFPLIVTPMYHNIGTGFSATITGGFSALLIPVPFIFYIYGKRIRAANKWSKGSVY